jgi:hypothetical protein
MANFTELPPELHQWVCKYLDPASLKALALVYRVTSPCARGMVNSNIHVDLSSGKVQGVHKVLAFLISQGHSTTQPPNVAITSTGDVFTDRVIKFASCIKTITLDVPSTNGIAAPVTNRQIKQYKWLVSNLETPNTIGAESWDLKFRRGDMGDMVHFLLQIARHVTTLECGDSLLWMKPTSTQGMCECLRTLRIVGLSNSYNSTHFAQLPSLETLEFASMRVLIRSVQPFGNNLSVSRLRFTNCHVMTDALTTAVQMCTALREFEYSLGHAFRYGPKKYHLGHAFRYGPGQYNLGHAFQYGLREYNLARLLFELRVHHATTLTNLTIRTEQCVVAGHCHYVEEIAQLTALRTLSINQDFLHFEHGGRRDYCSLFYRSQRSLFTANHRFPPTPADIFRSLPSSLETINFHISSQFQAGSGLNLLHQVSRVFREVSQEGFPSERFPNILYITFS